MDCRTFQKKLEDYLEGGLDFPARFGMERHARQCYLCGKEVADAQKLSDHVGRLQRVVAPPNFEEKVLTRIHTRESQSQLWRPWAFGIDWLSGRRLALGASSLVLLVLGVILATERFHWGNRDLPLASQRTVDETKTLAVPSMGTRRELDASDASVADVNSPSPLDQVSQPLLAGKPVLTLPRRARNSLKDDLSAEFAQPADSDYLEYSVPGPADRKIVMRLPKIIRMRYGQPSEEYFIRNVSH